jgi:drug/metabolite transporter (DMT)-like permease
LTITTKTPVLAIIGLISSWSSVYVAIRIGLSDYSPGSMALLRYFVASLVMAPIYLFMQKKRTKVRAKDVPLLFLLGTIGIGIYNITLNMGEQTVASGMTGFIIAQIPVLAIILANIFLKERLTLLGWFGVVVSVVGIFIISFGVSAPGQFNHGIWLLLISVICGAIYSVGQKPLMSRYKPLEVTTFAMWFGLISLLGWSPKLISELQVASIKSTLWVVYLGVVPAALGYFCWAYIVKCMQASKAVSYLYWIPGIATILGWLILGEVPTALSLFGGGLTILGASLVKAK